MIQYLRSLLFLGQMYVMMLVYAIAFLPWALIHPNGAFAACHSYARWVKWTASWMIGIKTEVRGTPPTGEVLIAAKHQSFFDIILIYAALPRAIFIMKRQLLWTPIFGQYVSRIGCIPVDRGKRGAAIEKMKRDVAEGRNAGGQLIIYPQGTRVAPYVKAPYKVGAGVLYTQLEQPCVPVAINVGLFWPRKGILRKPGTALVEFLDPIPPGMEQAAFMKHLEETVETASNRLMDEATGKGTP